MSSRSLNRYLRAVAGVSFAFTALTSMSGAHAAILAVGSTQTYKTIQAAVNAAKAGDTIAIDAGTYAAANITKSNLTIQGVGPTQPIIQGPVYGSKALFVISGTNTTVANLLFRNATDSQGNGAGIRMQGTNLTVLNSTFTNNQDGILSDYNVHSTITVKNSSFNHNGTCIGSGGCAHAIYAGHIGTLDVENSTFSNTQAGHSIKSRANNTIVMNNTIKDTPTGTSSYLIDVPNGGAVTITGNYLEKGAKSTNSTAAIAMGEEGALNPVGPMLIANNTFQNDFTKTQVFIWNKTGNAGLVVSDNVLLGSKTVELRGAGTISNTPPATVAMRTASNVQAAMANFAATPANFSAASATAVSEPATLWLFGAAILGLGFMGSRRKEAD